MDQSGSLSWEWPHSTGRPWREGKLELSRSGVNPIAELLCIGIDVSEPTNATTNDRFEIGAMLVKEVKIALFAADTSDGGIGLGLHASIRDGRPAILCVRKGKVSALRGKRGTEVERYFTSSKYIFFPFPFSIKKSKLARTFPQAWLPRGRSQI
jgi:hypothetical protein